MSSHATHPCGMASGPRRCFGHALTLCAFNLCMVSRAFVPIPLPPRRAVGHAHVTARSIRIPGAAGTGEGAYNLTAARINGIQRRQRSDNLTGHRHRRARTLACPPARPLWHGVSYANSTLLMRPRASCPSRATAAGEQAQAHAVRRCRLSRGFALQPIRASRLRARWHRASKGAARIMGGCPADSRRLPVCHACCRPRLWQRAVIVGDDGDGQLAAAKCAVRRQGPAALVRAHRQRHDFALADYAAQASLRCC